MLSIIVSTRVALSNSSLSMLLFHSLFSCPAPYPESSEDVTMEASADKRLRESPDVTLKPDGKSLKTSGTATTSPARPATKQVHAQLIFSCLMGVSSREQLPKPSAIRRKANDASEARLLIRQMHKRIPAWKLRLCIDTLNARPIDHARIAEVTEIQFVNDELVDVAAQRLVVARESESGTSSVGLASTTTAAPSQSEKKSTEIGQAPPEPEKEPEGTDEGI